ncbi:MAG: hydrogenase maturation protease [Actinomycetota bacterium]|nr:hydrogenase maturation protease [Actinomycetota bacterium]
MTGGRVLVGGVGYRWSGDGSFGMVASDALARLEWPEGVDVQDLGYGALHVALDLADADPPYERVILIAVTERGRQPGRLYRFRCELAIPDGEDVQARMYEAGAGVIDLDHLVVIGRHFGGLPNDVVAIELEPHPGTTGDQLSAPVQALLSDAIDLVRSEVLATAHPASA